VDHSGKKKSYNKFAHDFTQIK